MSSGTKGAVCRSPVVTRYNRDIVYWDNHWVIEVTRNRSSNNDRCAMHIYIALRLKSWQCNFTC